jgi:hypothetical protein
MANNCGRAPAEPCKAVGRPAPNEAESPSAAENRPNPLGKARKIGRNPFHRRPASVKLSPHDRLASGIFTR